MRRLNIPVLAISLVIGLAAQATEPPFTGRFLGSGRACYGTLAVDAKTAKGARMIRYIRNLVDSGG